MLIKLSGKEYEFKPLRATLGTVELMLAAFSDDEDDLGRLEALAKAARKSLLMTYPAGQVTEILDLVDLTDGEVVGAVSSAVFRLSPGPGAGGGAVDGAGRAAGGGDGG
jgi:hypothetical protein